MKGLCYTHTYFLQGLQLMHQNHVSHRYVISYFLKFYYADCYIYCSDCKFNNIMMDGFPLYLDHPHPIEQTLKRDLSAAAKYTSRTIKPVRYYFIDFGFSKQYSHDQSPLEEPPWGGDHSAPEFAADKPCNPFPVDVYCLGNVIRTRFMQVRSLVFMAAMGLTDSYYRVMRVHPPWKGSNSWRSLWMTWFTKTLRKDPRWTRPCNGSKKFKVNSACGSFALELQRPMNQ